MKKPIRLVKRYVSKPLAFEFGRGYPEVIKPTSKESSSVDPGHGPSLIRTSTLSGLQPAQTLNAYAAFPHKAMLVIDGDLDEVATNWTAEEPGAGRRLVQFTRTRSGSTITTSFTHVRANERLPNSVCISCIYWKDKKECFVTSIDVVYLLEQLVDARFTIEEKNRIRRNLEGFRPLTVNKGSDAANFWIMVMAFPAPKPRKIEKDFKVFYWKDLGSMLKKVIDKYVRLWLFYDFLPFSLGS